MALKDENNINFKKLEQELQTAVDADEKYQRENDAKFRAVGQKVATYDEFRDIVLASHLKPLEKGDRISDMGVLNQPWNVTAVNVHKSDKKAQNIDLSQQTIPINGQEFARDWRRYCKEKDVQYKYLVNIGGSALAKIFKVEVSCGLLGEIFGALVNFPSADYVTIVDILDNLRTVNRFGLSLQFLSSKESDVCKTLFEQLESAANDDSASCKIEMINILKHIYIR